MAEETKKKIKKKTDSLPIVRKTAVKKTAVKKTAVEKPAKKKAVAKTAPLAKAKKKTIKQSKYWRGVGRRKTASARVRIFSANQPEFMVNDKKLEEYFALVSLQQTARSPLKELDAADKFRVSVRVRGGGILAQAEAIRHGLSRALIVFEPAWRQRLKPLGFLTRDPRMKERKKFGLKKARRAPQWQKR